MWRSTFAHLWLQFLASRDLSWFPPLEKIEDMKGGPRLLIKKSEKEDHPPSSPKYLGEFGELERVGKPGLQDVINNKKAFDYLQAALGNTYKLDTQVGTSVKLLCMALSFQLSAIIKAWPGLLRWQTGQPANFGEPIELYLYVYIYICIWSPPLEPTSQMWYIYINV